MKPDVVMMGHWGNDTINALKQVHELGLKKDTKVFFNSIINAQAVGIPPEALDGVTMGMWWYHIPGLGIRDSSGCSCQRPEERVWRAARSICGSRYLGAANFEGANWPILLNRPKSIRLMDVRIS
jgi:hypothetical protein